MDLDEIQKLISFLDGTDVSEVEITKEGSTVRVTRYSATPPPAPVYAAAPVAPMQVAAVPGAPVPEAPPLVPNGQVVTSPMVGTFYRTPSPDSSAFVQEGDVVKKGQVVCIIEAMKLMNEIESEFSGRIVKIFKDNASPVEFGEELFLIEPA